MQQILSCINLLSVLLPGTASVFFQHRGFSHEAENTDYFVVGNMLKASSCGNFRLFSNTVILLLYVQFNTFDNLKFPAQLSMQFVSFAAVAQCIRKHLLHCIQDKVIPKSLGEEMNSFLCKSLLKVIGHLNKPANYYLCLIFTLIVHMQLKLLPSSVAVRWLINL